MSHFNKLVEKILQNQIFVETPPVLMDIGASGAIFEKWGLLAKRSICIAFDADDREFNINAVNSEEYKSLFKINRIVLPTQQDSSPFYLTSSPYCSSVLKPDKSALSDWCFAPLFDVVKEITLPTVTINETLKNLGLTYLDWYKVDSQGLDMDLFLSIDPGIRNSVLAADFEPGIMDAYIGENKLPSLMEMIEKENLWISTFEIRGTQRLNPKYEQYRNYLHESPCWAGITTLKNYHSDLTLRDTLLLLVFSLIENQWGFAVEICDKSKIETVLLNEIKADIIGSLSKHNLVNKPESIYRKIRRFGGKIIRKLKS